MAAASAVASAGAASPVAAAAAAVIADASALAITWGDNSSYWGRQADVPGALSPTVARLLFVCWFDVGGAVHVPASPPCTYYIGFRVRGSGGSRQQFTCPNVSLQVSVPGASSASPSAAAGVRVESALATPAAARSAQWQRACVSRWVFVLAGTATLTAAAAGGGSGGGGAAVRVDAAMRDHTGASKAGLLVDALMALPEAAFYDHLEPGMTGIKLQAQGWAYCR